jgi:hypothetical protein
MKYAGPRFFIPQKAMFVKWLKEHDNVMDICRQERNLISRSVFIQYQGFGDRKTRPGNSGVGGKK